jgi:hypothetical protein
MGHVDEAFNRWREGVLKDKKIGDTIIFCQTVYQIDITNDGRRYLIGPSPSSDRPKAA